MGKLIYSMLTSLDGYTEDEHGRFGWGAPEDEEVHSYINALASSLGTYLYGQSFEREIEKLSAEELAAFRDWFSNYDADAWDRQMEADVKAGKLDRLAAEALAEDKRGETREI